MRASCSSARTRRLACGTSNVPTPSTVSVGTKGSYGIEWHGSPGHQLHLKPGPQALVKSRTSSACDVRISRPASSCLRAPLQIHLQRADRPGRLPSEVERRLARAAREVAAIDGVLDRDERG